MFVEIPPFNPESLEILLRQLPDPHSATFTLDSPLEPSTVSSCLPAFPGVQPEFHGVLELAYAHPPKQLILDLYGRYFRDHMAAQSIGGRRASSSAQEPYLQFKQATWFLGEVEIDLTPHELKATRSSEGVRYAKLNPTTITPDEIIGYLGQAVQILGEDRVTYSNTFTITPAIGMITLCDDDHCGEQPARLIDAGRSIPRKDR